MNDDEIVRKAMSILGSRTSELKKIKSRLNAKRPRKRKKKPNDKSNSYLKPA